MLTVSWFYETFDHMLHEWPFMVLAGSFFIVTWVLKTGGIYLTGYKKFKNCVFLTLSSNLIFFGALFILFFLKIKPFASVQEFFVLLIVTAVSLDILFITIFSQKSSWLNGVFGILLADSLIIASITIFFAFQFYLLA
ncbi:MAG: hypothetical protein N2167_00195 [Flavobacteriales bacterium]|nr:hypothetical protein [Flavobacteriales bacterium]